MFSFVILVVFLFLISLFILIHLKRNDNISFRFKINLFHIFQIDFKCKSNKKSKTRK